MPIIPLSQVFGAIESSFEVVQGFEDSFKEIGVSLSELGAEVRGKGLYMKGSFENFQQGKILTPEEQLSRDTEAALAETRAIFKQNIQRQTEISASVEQVTESRDVQDEVRFEIAGMSVEEFVEKADYNNTSYRGPLRTLANKVYVTLKLIGEKLGLMKQKASPIEIISARGKGGGKFEVGENVLINYETQGWKNTPG